jgi:hypothetical protein
MSREPTGDNPRILCTGPVAERIDHVLVARQRFVIWGVDVGRAVVGIKPDLKLCSDATHRGSVLDSLPPNT